MRYYETIYIVNTNYDSNTVDKCKEEIEKELKGLLNAKIINHYIWSKKRLAYQIEKQKYGLFILLQFESDNISKMPSFNKWMKLNANIMRHMTVALNSAPEVYNEKLITDEDEPIEDNETSSKENIDAAKPTENESTPLDSELNEVGEGIEEDTNEIEKEEENDISES